jgi:hypothetical protein
MARSTTLQRDYNATYYQNNREHIRAQQAAYRLANKTKIQAARKGITLDQLDEMTERQDGCCAVCREPFAEVPHIDHNHACCPGSTACGRCVRGLLCASCNHMLGKARDSAAVLEAGATYLRSFERKDQ